MGQYLYLISRNTHPYGNSSAFWTQRKCIDHLCVMNNLANLSKYIGHSDWSEEQTPVTTEPQMAATYKQEKPQGLAKKLGVKKTVQSIF